MECSENLDNFTNFKFFASSVLNPKFNLICQAVDQSNDPSALRLARVCWWYYFSKFIEFLDTIFFILRKKNRQISLLHVYHHSSMPALWWLSVKIVPGGASYFGAMLNCGIHVLMYTYYALAACGPAFQKYLWWKKYMTTMQMLQFAVIVVHTLGLAYLQCGYPLTFTYLLLAYMISLILLFSNFYYQTYVKRDVSARHKPVKNGGTVTNGNGFSEMHNGLHAQNGLTKRNGVHGTYKRN